MFLKVFWFVEVEDISDLNILRKVAYRFVLFFLDWYGKFFILLSDSCFAC